MNPADQNATDLVFERRMSAKARLGFCLAAGLPLLAPYNLLIEPKWPDAPGLALLFAGVVSLGAVAVSVLLLAVAVFGINRRVEFDPVTDLIRVSESHLLRSKQNVSVRFADVSQLEIVCHDWSDGPSSYEIRLTPSKGKAIDFGEFASRAGAEDTLASLRKLVHGQT